MSKRRRRGCAITAVLTVAGITAACLLLWNFLHPPASTQGIETGYQTTMGSVSQEQGQTLTLYPEDGKKGNLLLANAWNPIPSEYEQADYPALFQTYPDRNFQLSNTEQSLQPEAAGRLNEMFAAAGKEKLTDYILWACYRTEADQQGLLKKEIEKYQNLGTEQAEKKALEKVAKPGTSEHQLGLAIDVGLYKSSGASVGTDTAFNRTQQGTWVIRNSWKYGWILRYPDDKKEITGIIYEPWHFRYVGEPHAGVITEKGLCLEEYIELIQKEKSMEVRDSQGVRYQIFYCKLEEGGVKVQVPKGEVTVSGDNQGGAIITCRLASK